MGQFKRVLKVALVLSLGVMSFSSGVFLPSASVSAAGSGVPTSCADVRAANPSASDGTYLLDLSGHLLSVFCANMASAPTDYLTVPQTGTQNFSLNGGDVGSSSMTTSFSKVRIDPSTLSVKIDDYTFATSTGTTKFAGPTPISDYPYATASDCQAPFDAGGSANVDVTGTPLGIINNFQTQGFLSVGSVSLTSNNQVANLTGGGFCGGTGPGLSVLGVNGAFDPYALHLQFIASVVTVDSLTQFILQIVADPQTAGGLVASVNSIGQAPNAQSKAGKLTAFDNKVNAQSGKKLTADQAAALEQLAAML